MQAMASDLATVLGELSDELATRPLEAPASLETLRSTLESANTVSMQLTKNRNALNQAQVSWAAMLIRQVCKLVTTKLLCSVHGFLAPANHCQSFAH